MRTLLFAAIAALFASCCAGGNCSKPADAQTSAVPEATSQELDEHTCTAACANGQHMYAHGEKGHVCDASCAGGTEAVEPALTEHVCTADCTGGQHMYAHGEKGHACDPTCQHAKSKRSM